MILTVSPSPAVDLTYSVSEVEVGAVNRATRASLEASGKGVNVSAVLTANGVPNIALAAVPVSPLGALWAALLQDADLDAVAVPVGPEMRLNTTLLTGASTKVNAPVGKLGGSAIEAILHQVEGAAQDCSVSWIVVAGSVFESDANPLFSGLRRLADRIGAKLAIDTSGPALVRAIAHRPDFIKPNKEELEALLGVTLPSLESLAGAARHLAERTHGAVFISNGGGTGIACVDSNVLAVTPPAIAVINSVGAGDATVAGFVAAAADGEDLVGCMTQAASWGATSCLSTKTVSPEGPTVPRRDIRTEWLVPSGSERSTPIPEAGSTDFSNVEDR